MTKLQEKTLELTAKQKKLGEVFKEAGAENDFAKVKCLGEIPEADKLKKVREMNTELTAIFDEVKQLQDIENAQRSVKDIGDFTTMPAPRTPPIGMNGGEQMKSIGKIFVESKSYKDYKASGNARGEFGFTIPTGPDSEMKTLFAEGTSWIPQSLRIPGLVIPYATVPVQALMYIPKGETTMQIVKYMEETTFTNAAAEKAEGIIYPEAALALAERTVTVQKITVTLPITDEQLADVPQAESYVNQRLPFMLMQRLDRQVQIGDGNSPNLLGITNLGSTQTYTQAGNDTMEDAIFKSMVKVQFTGFAFANMVIMYPFDWQTIRLHRTTQGLYIWGNPSEAVPVVMSNNMSAGTAVIGDFANYCQLFERTGIDVQVGYVNDDFIKGRRAIRADTRQAMVWYRPAAFCLAGSLA
jgi:HK97 family phage major capsid protein